MYPFEQYMKILKEYVRNWNRLEDCIVECYIYEEVVEFYNKYLSNLDVVGLSKRVFTNRINDNDNIRLVVVTVSQTYYVKQ